MKLLVLLPVFIFGDATKKSPKSCHPVTDNVEGIESFNLKPFKRLFIKPLKKNSKKNQKIQKKYQKSRKNTKKLKKTLLDSNF